MAGDVLDACPVCGLSVNGIAPLASHLVALADDSDSRHVMWLNRHVTKICCSAEELQPLLAAALEGRGPDAATVRR